MFVIDGHSPSERMPTTNRLISQRCYSKGQNIGVCHDIDYWYGHVDANRPIINLYLLEMYMITASLARKTTRLLTLEFFLFLFIYVHWQTCSHVPSRSLLTKRSMRVVWYDSGMRLVWYESGGMRVVWEWYGIRVVWYESGTVWEWYGMRVVWYESGTAWGG